MTKKELDIADAIASRASVPAAIVPIIKATVAEVLAQVFASDKSCPLAPAKADGPLLWDVGQTAKALGVSSKTVQRMAAAGELPGSVKIARRRCFSRKVIEAWIEKGCPRIKLRPAARY